MHPFFPSYAFVLKLAALLQPLETLYLHNVYHLKLSLIVLILISSHLQILIPEMGFTKVENVGKLRCFTNQNDFNLKLLAIATVWILKFKNSGIKHLFPVVLNFYSRLIKAMRTVCTAYILPPFGKIQQMLFKLFEINFLDCCVLVTQ